MKYRNTIVLKIKIQVYSTVFTPFKRQNYYKLIKAMKAP